MSEIFLNAPAPALAEPEEGEEGDEMVFVRNGWVRITIAGVMYKLRRPFLGELRDLEATMDHCNAELKKLAEDLKEREEVDQAAADANADEVRALGREPVLSDDDWAAILALSDEDREDLDVMRRRRVDRRRADLNEESTKLMLQLQARFRELSHVDRDLRAGWWAQAFKVLTPTGHPEPESMPSWVGNAMVQNQVLAHWQSSPLAPGSA